MTRSTASGAFMLTLVLAVAAATAPHAQHARPDSARLGSTVTVNRTAPTVARPPLHPLFSERPTESEVRRARVFSEPLVPLGPTSDAENRALATALAEFRTPGQPFSTKPLDRFLEEYRSSAWRASLLANMGRVHRANGFLSRALKDWDEAWRLSERETSREGRAVADTAAASALDCLSTLGYVPGLDTWLTRVDGRAMIGPAAAKVERARAAHAIIEMHPDRVIPSGPFALQVLLATRSGARDLVTPPALKDYKPTADGVTLKQLTDMAGQVGLALQPAKSQPAAAPVVPSVVHLRFDHFSALVREEHGRYLLRDPAIGGDVWMTREALTEETSGYALVPDGALPVGWSAVSSDEASAVIGHSCPPGQPSPDENMCPIGGDRGQSGGGCSGGSCGGGMPVYGFDPLQASVILNDVPLGYAPPRGPEVSLRLRYNQREENEPILFSFSNIGHLWWANWFAYVEEIAAGCTAEACTSDFEAVHVPEGGVERYAYRGPGSQGRTYRTPSILWIVSDDPIRVERRLADGSTEVYDVSDGAAVGERRIFLSRIVDADGQAVQFTWDAQLRLVAVTDAIGQVTTLQYDDPADVHRVTSVTDPFGRIARFTYNTQGDLISMTDVAGLTTFLNHEGTSTISSMTTPYGTTVFRTPQMAAQYDRAVEAVDPLGAVERAEFRYLDAPVPASLPPAEVPPAFTAYNNGGLNQLVSLYWPKGSSFARVEDATWFQWRLYTWDPFLDQGWAVGMPRWKQVPGEARIWYGYGSGAGTGDSAKPTITQRQLPDGTTYQVWLERDLLDNTTHLFDPLNRETRYQYAANQMDLLEVRNVTSGRNDLLATYADYTAGHRPQTLTDAAGQVTRMTYNAAGQVLTVTNAKQEQTTYAYDPSGYLQSVTGPVAGATTTYTYDAYGRVRTITSDGATITYDYDALDRPTKVTYPDGTYEETTYDRLDVGTRRDRRGRLTEYTYNARRQPMAVRDPAGRVVQQQWGATTGALDALVDANAHKTRWERDLTGRVLREIRADNLTTTQYTYDSLGRLRTVTDPKQQVATYSYYLDGTLASIGYTNAEIPTPGVTWTYDPAYSRVTSMVDRTGLTTYAYQPVGQLGALKLATVDGPLTNDIITYTYSELGRVVTRAINGIPLGLSYDSLGRVEREINALGTFTYTYDGPTGRLATVTYPNGQMSAYDYYPATQDHRLHTIHHKYPNGATLSKFDYTYDTVGNILTWRQQADTTAVLWEYGYDHADQLVRAVKRATDPQGTILQRFAYGYDPAGNRLFEQIDDQVTSWTYDKLNRLVDQRAGGLLRVAGSVDEPSIVRINGQPASVDANGVFVGGVSVSTGTSSFTVTATDVSGNTATNTYEIDQTGPAKVFQFDANGNLASDGIRTLEWDARNQLVSVSVGAHRTEFTYDGLRRRVDTIQKVGGTPQSSSRGLWCDGELCEARDSATSQPLIQFFAQGYREADETNLTVHDHLSSPWVVTGLGGEVHARIAYEPFGSYTANGASIPETAFAGLRTSAEPSIMLAQFRAYDSDLAGWLSEDPLGATDITNLYTYAHNNPVNAADPLGLFAIQYNFNYRTAIDIEGYCPPNASAACTQGITARLLYTCSDSPCGKSTPTLTLRVYGTMYLSSLPARLLRRQPCDKSVVDARTAFAHEIEVHIQYGVDAVEPLIKDLERTFPSKRACEAACGNTATIVSARFGDAVRYTQDAENKRCR